MPNAIKYVDNVNGNNGNTGDSEAQAYADIPTAIAAISGGGNTIYVQAGSPYVLTSSIALTAGLKGDFTDGRNKIVGYTTTPGSFDGKPTITSATNSVNLFSLNDNDYWEWQHLNLTHTAATRGAAFSTATSNSTPLFFTDVTCDGCLGFNAASNQWVEATLTFCEIKNCTSNVLTFQSGTGANCYLYECDIHDNAGNALNMSGFLASVFAENCIFDTNAIGINFSSASNAVILDLCNCLIISNSSSGIKIAATSSTVTTGMQNNIFWANGGYGIENLDGALGASPGLRVNRNNAYGSNTSGAYTGINPGVDEITLSADPFTDIAGRDFSPNNTAGGGALLRGARFAVIGQTDGGDIGAVQHIDAGGASEKSFTFVG